MCWIAFFRYTRRRPLGPRAVACTKKKRNTQGSALYIERCFSFPPRPPPFMAIAGAKDIYEKKKKRKKKKLKKKKRCCDIGEGC
ncbi:hypothetical protein ANTPLA_LOCUS3240 [Anthophora plagiata]